MMIQELISITDELNNLLDQVTTNNREESIQSIQRILKDRQSILDQLDIHLVKNDPSVKQLLLDEIKIKKKMDHILNDIKKDIQQVSKKRTSGGNYINPYKNLRVNGAFFDKKK